LNFRNYYDKEKKKMENINLIIMSVVALLLLGGLLFWYKRKMAKVEEEVNLLKKEKEYYSEAIMVLSDEYEVIYSNQAAKSLFGGDEDYEIRENAKNIQLKIDTSDPDDFFTVLEKTASRKEDIFHLQNVLLVIDGKMKQVNIYVDKSAWNRDKTISCVIDLRAITPSESKGVTKANGSMDFLTGLPSQFLALSDINTISIEAKKRSETFRVFLLGIDHFNDLQISLGLGYTNRILKNMANHLKDHTHKNMKIYRMDGDKFMILIKNMKEEEEARKIARDIIASVGGIYQDNNEIRLTSSMGIAMYPKDGLNATKLIDNAYIALHKAQIGSESNIEFCNEEYQTVRTDEVKMNEEIIKGLKKNEFLLHYQPIFDLEGEKIVGAEALIRWKHPEHGLISADKFLHIAEKTGLIVELGEYVFNEAIKQRQRCEDIQNENFKITINLSLKEMQVTALIPRLEMLFAKYKVARNTINLDITERDAMENITKTENDFKLLKDFGISLSLDHFGAGYSSLKHLALLPIDTIKIDRAMIFDLTLNVSHQTTVKAMIELAHTLGFEVVAEGVETSDEATILSALKCDYAQGYLYSRPLPVEDFEALLG